MRLHIFLLVLLGISPLCTAADAQTDLITYYPAPQGEYDQIRLTPMQSQGAVGSTCANNGLMYYNVTDNKVYYCSGSAWQVLGGGGLSQGTAVCPPGQVIQKLTVNSDGTLTPFCITPTSVGFTASTLSCANGFLSGVTINSNGTVSPVCYKAQRKGKLRKIVKYNDWFWNATYFDPQWRYFKDNIVCTSNPDDICWVLKCDQDRIGAGVVNVVHKVRFIQKGAPYPDMSGQDCYYNSAYYDNGYTVLVGDYTKVINSPKPACYNAWSVLLQNADIYVCETQ